MPTDVTRTSTLDRLLRAGGMFIRDEYGAIGLCFVACRRPLDFIEAQSSNPEATSRIVSSSEPGSLTLIVGIAASTAVLVAVAANDTVTDGPAML